jgi:hypothetical protein
MAEVILVMMAYALGIGVGAMFWRSQAIAWRNSVGYMGRRDHK